MCRAGPSSAFLLTKTTGQPNGSCGTSEEPNKRPLLPRVPYRGIEAARRVIPKSLDLCVIADLSQTLQSVSSRRLQGWHQSRPSPGATSPAPSTMPPMQSPPELSCIPRSPTMIRSMRTGR